MAINSIDKQIQSLEDKSQEVLLEVIGAYALSQQPSDLTASLAANGMINVENIRESANKYLESIKPILNDSICGPDGIAHYAEQATVKDIITVLLPALGFSTIGVVPTAIIAVGIIIARSGVREYCKNYNQEK